MFSSALRYLILWSSRLAGAIHNLLDRKPILHLLIIAVIAIGLWLGDQATALWTTSADITRTGVAPPISADRETLTPAEAETRSQDEEQALPETPETESSQEGEARDKLPPTKSWLTLWNVLSIWAFVFVVWWVLRARRRLVISKFEDYTEKEAGVDAGGFGLLVTAELSALSGLFNEFEAGRAIQTIPDKLTPLDASFQTESPSAFLERAVSAETEFSLGPFRVPVGIILTLVGQLVQGPRIAGQIHRDGDSRIITIQLVGSRGQRGWRIQEAAQAREGDKPVWRSVSDLAHEVACRIFSELALDRPVNWRALRSFVAGVHAYRRSLRTPGLSKLDLREAENSLIEALAHDPHFDLAYYNLGVVYLGLDQLDAAQRAFERALEENNLRWSTNYALGLTNRHLAERAFNSRMEKAARWYLSKAIDHCDQALHLAPTTEAAAQVLDLKALVLWWRAWRMWPDRPEAQFPEFRSSNRVLRGAIWTGWWALCRSEVGVETPPGERARARDQARALASRHLQGRSSIALLLAELGTSMLRKPVPGTGDMQPGAPRVLLMMQRGMFLRQATRDLRQARSITPQSAEVQLALGSTYLKRGWYKAATDPLQIAVRLSPNSPKGWGFLAVAFAHRDRRDQVDEASQRLMANLWNLAEAREALESLAAAMDTLKQLFADIEVFKDEFDQQANTMRRWRRLLRFLPRYMGYGYRLAGRGGILALKVAGEELRLLLQSPENLRNQIDRFDEVGRRAKQLAGFPYKVRDLSQKGEDGVLPLKRLMSKKLKAGHDWEVGEIGHALGNLYLRLGRLEVAEECVRGTIAHLAKSLPSEVQRRGLHALLSRILRLKGNHSAALLEALKGKAQDPVSAYERNELGWAYWSLAEHRSAQSAWEDALSLDPNNPRLHMNLGLAHLSQWGDSKNKAVRSQRLDQATRHLKTALDMLEDADADRHEAHFLLAQTHSWAGRYGEAVYELRALDRSDYCNLAVALYLADACFANEDWTDAELHFRRLAVEVDQGISTAKEGPNEIVDSPPLAGPIVLGSASAFAHLGIAASLAAREIKLPEALSEVRKARAMLKNLSDGALKAQWASSCDFQEGVILFKHEHIEEAIAKLESALSGNADADTYFSLAGALARKAELAHEADEKAELVRRATRYYQEAQRLDWTDQLKDKIAKALAQVEAASSQSNGSVQGLPDRSRMKISRGGSPKRSRKSAGTVATTNSGQATSASTAASE